MSTTTPSHIETKLSERIRAVASEYNIPLSRDIMVGDDILEQFATDAEELEARLAALEALSRQPEQAPDIEKIREHIWGIMRSIGSASIHEDPAKNKEYLQQAADRTKSALEFVRELKVQPAQTDDLEARAREWVRKTYGLTLAANSAISFDTSEFVKLVAAFARSLSEPK